MAVLVSGAARRDRMFRWRRRGPVVQVGLGRGTTGRTSTAVGRGAPRARVSGVQGTVRRHVDVLRQRARAVRRLLVHDEQAAPEDPAQVSAVPVTVRPPERGRRRPAVPGPVLGVCVRHLPAAGAGLGPQAARVHVRHQGDVHLSAQRLSRPGIRAVGRRARVTVPARPSRPVHGCLLLVVGRLRRHVPARGHGTPVLRLRLDGNVHDMRLAIAIMPRSWVTPALRGDT